MRNEITTPKSRAERRSIPLGPVAVEALEEQYRTNPLPRRRLDRVRASCSRHTARPDEARTACEDRDAEVRGAREVPTVARSASHGADGDGSGGSVRHVRSSKGRPHARFKTERYLHAARTSYPDAAELAEARLFSVSKEAPIG